MKTLWALALLPIGLALAGLWFCGLMIACYTDSISPTRYGA